MTKQQRKAIVKAVRSALRDAKDGDVETVRLAISFRNEGPGSVVYAELKWSLPEKEQHE